VTCCAEDLGKVICIEVCDGSLEDVLSIRAVWLGWRVLVVGSLKGVGVLWMEFWEGCWNRGAC